MNKRIKLIAQILGASLAVLVLMTSCASTGISSRPSEPADAQGIVDKARVTFGAIMRDNQYTWLHDNLRHAKGILIFPQVIKGGFFLGGSGGTGILMVRDDSDKGWSQPAFYTLGSVTFGLQIGGESAEVVMLVMSRKAVDSLLASSVKLGGDTSVALGPVGMGAKGDVTADFISFTKSKGLYAGLNLEGSVMEVRDSLNRAYYGKDVRPVDIVVKRDVGNAGSMPLRERLMHSTR